MPDIIVIKDCPELAHTLRTLRVVHSKQLQHIISATGVARNTAASWERRGNPKAHDLLKVLDELGYDLCIRERPHAKRDTKESR